MLSELAKRLKSANDRGDQSQKDEFQELLVKEFIDMSDRGELSISVKDVSIFCNDSGFYLEPCMFTANSSLPFGHELLRILFRKDIPIYEVRATTEKTSRILDISEKIHIGIPGLVMTCKYPFGRYEKYALELSEAQLQKLMNHAEKKCFPDLEDLFY